MKLPHVRRIGTILSLAIVLVWASAGRAQNTNGSLRGQVIDPSGAAVTDATVLLTLPSGASIDTPTNKEGFYEFTNLAPGKYAVKAVAKGFALFTQENVNVSPGQTARLNISLKIEVQEEKVNVTDSSTNVDVSPASNASAIVLQGKDLEALSDDPDELQSELQALAGPSAGPNGGQIYIDGFTGGQLPPKSSIREIRINQNPFSAEYDRLGYGRIEIFTKPGTDQFHGQFFLTGNTAGFNSRNPFQNLPPGTQSPGYESTQISGNIGGPLSKKASFFFNIEDRNINDLHIVSTPVVDPNTFQIVQFSDTVPNPGRRLNLGPRFDYQISPGNTLTVRYQYFHNRNDNEGIGQFSLAAQGFNSLSTEQTLQIGDTQILSPKVINETRFEFQRETSQQTPLSTTPAIEVQGAFSGGGNTQGSSTDTLDHYELQNYTSMNFGKHFLKFGVRLRGNRDDNFATANFNGAFTFSSIQAYQTTVQGLAQGMSLATIIANGGGANQYSIATGTGRADVTYVDAGLYVQDDWRIRQNITLSYGLRFESQDNIGDHADFAPRFGAAWGIGGNAKNPPKTVVRGGAGIFYDRFTTDLILRQQRLNGVIQQQFTFANPNFFLDSTGQAPPLNVLLSTQQPAAISPTIYVPNSDLRTPYTIQTGVSLERQLTKVANLSLTYLHSRGVHQFFTENTNPPICSSFPCDPTTTPRLNGPDNIYQYQSEGIFKQNQLILNSSVRMGAKLSVFGYYMLNYANSDASGAGSFPSINNNISLNYGRAAFDIRHRVFFGGTVGLPYAFRLSPFLIVNSGMPYTVTIGQDLNGDSIFNDRPAIAGTNPAKPKSTQFGTFDLVPQPGETIVPVNSLTGPGRFSLNLRLSKTFGFGKKREATNAGVGGPAPNVVFGRGPGGGGSGGGRGGGGGGRGGFGGGFGGDVSANHRFGLTFGISARNIFNNVNLATPVGSLSSPLFGSSNGLAGQPFSSSTANRRIDLQVTFTF